MARAAVGESRARELAGARPVRFGFPIEAPRRAPSPRRRSEVARLHAQREMTIPHLPPRFHCRIPLLSATLFWGHPSRARSSHRLPRSSRAPARGALRSRRVHPSHRRLLARVATPSPFLLRSEASLFSPRNSACASGEDHLTTIRAGLPKKASVARSLTHDRFGRPS
jgi:hypothetical protein